MFFFLIFFYLFSSVQFNSISPVIANFFFLQHLPVAQAAPIYEQLLSVFPTAVSFIVIVVRIILALFSSLLCYYMNC